MARTREWKTWVSMRSRCNNPNDEHYKHYGARGIEVCCEWKDFEKFYQCMGKRPKGTTLDRIDVNGNYCEGNCRWSNQEVQCNNKRNNLLITFNGKLQSIPQWSRELGISIMTIRNRILTLKWPIEKALTK